MNNSSSQVSNEFIDDEISVKDLIDFLARSWKIILTSGAIGLFLAIGYLWITPPVWEATAQIQMAQISVPNNPQRVNVEEPNALISRMRIPTKYHEAVMKICGLDSQANATETMVNLVRLAPIKGLNSVVELKIALQSRERVHACAESVFQIVKTSQEDITNPLIEDAQRKLADYAKRLLALREVVARADRSNASFIAYFEARDEIRYLIDETMKLQELIYSKEKYKTKLVAPIYVAEQPIAPKTKKSLLVGSLAGIFIGILGLLVRKFFTKYKKT